MDKRQSHRLKMFDSIIRIIEINGEIELDTLVAQLSINTGITKRTLLDYITTLIQADRIIQNGTKIRANKAE